MRNIYALYAPFFFLLLFFALPYSATAAATTSLNKNITLKNSTHHSAYRLDPPSRNLYTVIEKCIPPQKDVLLHIGPVTRCPCFVSFQLSSPIPSKVDVDFFVMTIENYNLWEENRFQGLPTYLPNYSTIAQKANAFSMAYDFFFYQTPDQELNQQADFIFVVRTSSSVDDCQLQIMTIFDKKPKPCPERLPQPKRNQRHHHITVKQVTKERPPLPPIPNKRVTSLGPNSNSNNVVAGTTVTDDAIRSYMVSITFASGACSGTVIGANWILTAAHCRIREGATALVGGTTNLQGTPYQIEQFIPHPNYTISNGTRLEPNDIALVKTKRAIENFKPVHINTQKSAPTPNQHVRASGYGQIAEGWVISSKARYLLQVDMPVVAFDRCIRAFVEYGAIEFAKALKGNGQLCVGFVDGGCGGDTCYGDSGGPVVVRGKNNNYIQVGIVSGGLGCARLGLPGVYTRVASYYNWIQETVNNSAVGENIEGQDESIDIEVNETVEKTQNRMGYGGRVSRIGLVLTLSAVGFGVLLTVCLLCGWIGSRWARRHNKEKVVRETSQVSNKSESSRERNDSSNCSREEVIRFDKTTGTTSRDDSAETDDFQKSSYHQIADE